jgi:hypothetical protein
VTICLGIFELLMRQGKYCQDFQGIDKREGFRSEFLELYSGFITTNILPQVNLSEIRSNITTPSGYFQEFRQMIALRS